MDTIQNGKGDDCRIGNFKAYWESDLWKNLAKKKGKVNDKGSSSKTGTRDGKKSRK